MSIYKLKLHETLHDSGGNIDITRVPGGWLYYYVFRKTTTFVAFNDDCDYEAQKDKRAEAHREIAANAFNRWATPPDLGAMMAAIR